MFKAVLVMLVMSVCVMAAVDSATVVNTVNTVSTVAQGIAQGQNNQLLAVIIAAAANVFTTVFGLLWHYKKSNKGK
jgi:Na+-transporting methylmalonyl-CoA/oxaloacetate decarboxylase gamma subunit